MDGRETRDTVMIAVSLVLLAALLWFVAYLMQLRADFAEVRNREIVGYRTLANYYEFNKYNNTDDLFAEDVVAAIMDYRDSTIRIKVKRSDGTLYPGAQEEYTRNTPSSQANYGVLMDLLSAPSSGDPNKVILRKYRSVLVFGEVDLNDVDLTWTSEDLGVSSDVSAIVFFHIGDVEVDIDG